MALSGIKPFVHVSDSNGNPYVGAKLYVYLPTTTTLASIYSDAGLSVPMANPMTGATASDASGNFPRFYIAAGTYKLRAETSAGVLIWQEDTIDTGLSAGSGALAVASGGTGGTTATAARTNLDVPSNSDLTTLSATITALQSTLTNLTSIPQGRLTLTTGVPVLATTVTAGTNVYYTPYIGKLLPIYDGSQFNTTAFTELTMALNSNHTANSIYDLYIISDSSTIRLVTGPAWGTTTDGAGSRGAGAGTTELTQLNGIWVNKYDMTARYGATTLTVTANRGTYVGSMLMDGTNGQVTHHTSYGQSRKAGIWNLYNQTRTILLVGDATATHTYASATYRPFNNSATNSARSFIGLPMNSITARYDQVASGSGGASAMAVGIGINSTTAPTGYVGQVTMGSATFSAASGAVLLVPGIGTNTITQLESSQTATTSYNGTEAGSRMAIEYLG